MGWFTFFSLAWAAFIIMMSVKFWRKGQRVGPIVMLVGTALIVLGRIMAAQAGAL